MRVSGLPSTDQEALQVIAEVLANTAAGAKHDVFGSTHHRLYRLPVDARATCFDRAHAIAHALALAGYRVERASDGGIEN